ncbi:preprotein translocase subunit SecE [Rhodococcus qingshengii]|uniref:preprotein translocase subunit SecE n=1 Tax=Rhodococcus TaxID=1827 RepID=UPI000EEFD666|nr:MULTISPECIES: preprotein translocase subunit SecE [Rhodococcus]MBQ7805301.1 preprotein translocase subunit SecE [Rhodococcus sp. (in: high G+C Gram-positive bacteria)]RGP45089.1 preprotein translocase subunit SecE [Rhodococcus erythropolis]
MSEERAKRDADTSDAETSPSADSTGVDDTAADATTRSDLSLDKDGAEKAPSASSGVSNKPTGKRAARGASVSASTVKTPARTSSAKPTATNPGKKPKAKKDNIFKRLRKFFREVIAELRKVIWPNRKQMITYTSVVLTFVVFMVAFISGVDIAVIKGVTWLFG